MEVGAEVEGAGAVGAVEAEAEAVAEAVAEAAGGRVQS